MQRGGGDRLGWRARASRPDQDCALFIDGDPLGLDEFHLEIFEGVLLEMELPFERTVGDATATLEHIPRVIQNLLEGHGRPSAAAVLPLTASTILNEATSRIQCTRVYQEHGRAEREITPGWGHPVAGS